MEKEKNPMHYCMNCNKWLGFRGFCSLQCHNEHFDYYSSSPP